jgi:N-acetyl-anhydromuramyl-L-alanine amidase AmpD
MIEPSLNVFSPNYNRLPSGQPALLTAQTVIIHATRSGISMNPSEFMGTLNYMTRQGTVSSHWVIARDGQTARVIGDNHQAWHAQEDNDNTWGIEIEQGVETDGFTPEQMASLVAVCKGYVADFGVAPAHVQDSKTSGFVGHQETVQGRRNGKSDPGSLFDWDGFIAALKEDDLSEAEKQELDERRAKAELDIALLFKYRVQPRDNGWVEIVGNDGASFNPPLLVDVTRV